MILDSLRYWVTEMHVDGFRFDLASVLARDADGSFTGPDAPLLAAIRTDPILRDVHLIAEPWDAAGRTSSGRGSPARSGTSGTAGSATTSAASSAATAARSRRSCAALRQRRPVPRHPRDARRPSQSINYVTCHDGFTLYDLVAYDRKHNEANGHGNADGTATT